MRLCSFCGAPADMKAGRLALCGACRAALCGVEPGEARYAWFSGAVRRAMFGDVASRRATEARLSREAPKYNRRLIPR